MHNDLSTETQTWITNHFGKSVIVNVMELKGGISSNMYKVIMQTRNGMMDIVLRQIVDQQWLKEEPDVIIHEARALATSSLLSVKTPNVIGYDAYGDICGVPTLMMSKICGATTIIHKSLELY